MSGGEALDPAAGMLSVVVIGRNEGERLRRCLASIAGMESCGLDVEVVYVDSGSGDGSVALAEAMGARTIALRPARPTAALGRNAGWRAARGAAILFLDGDTILDAGFVRESLGSLLDGRTAVVWGHRRELAPDRSMYNRVLDLDWMYAAGLTPFCGGDALMRREALKAAGGFDETLIAGEEPELCRRMIALGWEIRHVDRAMTLHDLDVRRFAQYWRRAVRAGHAYAEVAERFAEAEEPFWRGEVRRNFVRAGVLSGVGLAGVGLSAVLGSVVPAAVCVALFGALVVRTAWKVRWKSGSWGTLLLYGVHSHVQQIPIAWGQLGFRRDRLRGRRAELMEYKGR